MYILQDNLALFLGAVVAVYCLSSSLSLQWSYDCCTLFLWNGDQILHGKGHV